MIHAERILGLFKEANQAVAFIHNDEKFTYSDIFDLTKTYLENIKLAGIKSGDITALNADYSPHVFCYILALALNKCIVIPFSNNSVIELDSGLEISGCDWFIKNTVNTAEFIIANKYIAIKSQLLIDFMKRGESGVILFSSGSSGKPKAILHSIETILSKFSAPKKATITIPFLMIDHFGGLNTIFGVLCSLGTVVTVADRSIDSICKAIEKYRVELLPTTPSFLSMLLASKVEKKYDLSSLKKISYGTEVMPEVVLNKIHALFPQISLQQTYGLSEVGVMQSKSREDGSIWVKLGGVGFETKVIDGILWVKSKFSMIGYLNAKTEFDDDGFFNTHDLVETEGEYFRIRGRNSDLINVGGQKVYPIEVEDLILSLQNIQDVSIFGESHPFLGQIVVARIALLSPEDPALLKARVRKACIHAMSAYKAPVKVYIDDVSLYSVRHKKIRKQVS